MSLLLKSLRSNGLRATARAISRRNQIREGTLVGTDQLGNKYFESLDTTYLRDRWVELANEHDDASGVPSDWHAWMHHISDKPPTSPDGPKHPFYYKGHTVNPTGTPDAYLPPNHLAKSTYKGTPQMYQAWNPSSGDS